MDQAPWKAAGTPRMSCLPRQQAADRAAWGLAHQDPAASAALGLTHPQKWFVAVMAGVLAASAVFAPAALLTALLTSLTIAALALAAFRLAAMCTTPRPADTPVAPATHPRTPPAPRYTAIAALYQEANVLAALVEGLEALEYPRDHLQILLVLEADDHATRAAAARMPLPAGMRVLIVPPGAPRTKPRALNYALGHATGDLITVFDAEDRPHPGQLRAAAAAFATGGSRLACVQAPLGWRNAGETWLTRQFALEYAAQFHVILPALARWGWPLPLGGTSNHFRAKALRAVGGWDAHNVTEDADLGFRLAREGWRSAVITPGTQEECVTGWRAWRRQRSRWIKGFMQTWTVHMRRPVSLMQQGGRAAQASLQLTIGLSVLASFSHAPLAAALVLGSLGVLLSGAPAAPLIAPWALAGLSFAVSSATALLGARRAGLRDVAGAVLSAPLYWALHTPAAFSAAWSLVRTPFHWEKTAHGVSRQAQETSAPARPVPAKPAPSRAHHAPAPSSPHSARRATPPPASRPAVRQDPSPADRGRG